MNKHIGKIDKQLAVLNHQIDSIKNTEFSFQYDEKDMNAVLKEWKKHVYVIMHKVLWVKKWTV